MAGSQASTPLQPLDHRPPGDVRSKGSALSWNHPAHWACTAVWPWMPRAVSTGASRAPQPRLALGVWGEALKGLCGCGVRHSGSLGVWVAARRVPGGVRCGTQGPWGVGCGAEVTVTLRPWSTTAGSTHPSERFHKTLIQGVG